MSMILVIIRLIINKRWHRWCSSSSSLKEWGLNRWNITQKPRLMVIMINIR